MRKEHKYHVIIVTFMMLVVLGTFVFVIVNRSEGFNPTITTSIPTISQTEIPTTNNQTIVVNSEPLNNSLTDIGKIILFSFLIIFALLFIIYISIKITKELKNNQQP